MKNIAYEGPPMEKGLDEAEKTPPRSKGSPFVPVLRTFQADIVKETEKTTRLAVLMAERARKEKEELSRISMEDTGTHLGRTIFLLLLILAFGIGVGVYALIGTRISIPSHSETKSPPANEQVVKNPVVKKDVSIALDNPSREEIVANIAQLFEETSLTRGDIQIVKFTASDPSGNAAQAAPISILLTRLGTDALPEGLLRSLDATPVYGIYSAQELVGFLKLRSRSYPETFAGMLAWEGVMQDTLISLLNPRMKKNDIALFHSRAFKDERIAGIPARVLSDPDGLASIAYAFPDPKTLIIAGDRETLRTLVERSRSENK